MKTLALFILSSSLVTLSGCDGSKDAEGTAGDAGGSPGADASGNPDGGTGGDPDGGTGGVGVDATGSFGGNAVAFHCVPPTDLGSGVYFNHQNPMQNLDVWSFNCQTADHTIQLWFQVKNPTTGRSYAAPANAADFYVKLGDPMDVDPLGVYSTNMVENTVTISAVDGNTDHLAATYRASWSNGGGKYGEVQGTVDVTGWK